MTKDVDPPVVDGMFETLEPHSPPIGGWDEDDITRLVDHGAQLYDLDREKLEALAEDEGPGMLAARVRAEPNRYYRTGDA